MVYDATQSGLNGAVWVPLFAMPTIDSHLRAVEARTFMTDCDVGETFLNFMLEPAIRLHAGVDLSKRFPDEGDDKLTAYWERILIGFEPSPYFMTNDMMIIEEAVRGLRSDVKLFSLVKSSIHLPGMKSYDPSRPWMYRAREDGSLAADVFWYIDDGRPTAATAWYG